MAFLKRNVSETAYDYLLLYIIKDMFKIKLKN
jgi:hypothetical protein